MTDVSCFSDNEVLGGILTWSQGHCLDEWRPDYLTSNYLWYAWFCNWDYMNRKFVQYRLVTVLDEIGWTAMCNKTTLDWQSYSLFDIVNTSLIGDHTTYIPLVIDRQWLTLFYKNTNFMYNKLLYTGFDMVWFMEHSILN